MRVRARLGKRKHDLLTLKGMRDRLEPPPFGVSGENAWPNSTRCYPSGVLQEQGYVVDGARLTMCEKRQQQTPE